MTLRVPAVRFLLGLLVGGLAVPLDAVAAQGGRVEEDLPPPGYGSLTQNDLSLRIRNDDLEVRFIPLDIRVTRLLARDSYEALRGLIRSHQRAIDSVASQAGVSRPGLAMVTFFGQRVNARFDPQILTLFIRNRVFVPLGIVPFTPRFNSQQLDVREQVTAIYLFEEEIPVDDSFTLVYAGRSSEDWQNKQRLLDRERARVSARARVNRPDSVAAGP